jgi:hypothetical protein
MDWIDLAQVSIRGGIFLASWVTLRLQSWISRARLYWAGVSTVNVMYNRMRYEETYDTVTLYFLVSFLCR